MLKYRNDTFWLLYWWFEWFKRLLNTSWHLVNRNAYRRWSQEHYGADSGRQFHLDVQDALIIDDMDNGEGR